jgi:hypothetical protein
MRITLLAEAAFRDATTYDRLRGAVRKLDLKNGTLDVFRLRMFTPFLEWAPGAGRLGQQELTIERGF